MCIICGELAALVRNTRSAATGGSAKASILADTTEALIGAVHISGGIEASEVFVHGVFDPLIAASEEAGTYTDFKTALQELCSHRGWDAPVYDITGTGPDHQRVFTAVVLVDGKAVSTGTAPSKKTAEQRAATSAHRLLAGSPDA